MNLRGNRTTRIATTALAASACLVAYLAANSGAASAQDPVGAPSSLAFSMLSPHAGVPTGATFSYTSVSGWRSTNVVMAMPGWAALQPFASTGAGPCPPAVLISATTASRGGRATFSQCTLTQQAGGAQFSVVVTSSSGLDGPVSVTLPDGMLRNPIAPSTYAVRLSEQSDAGWMTLSEWTAVSVPTNYELTLSRPAPGSLTAAKATYISASSWEQTNVVLLLPDFSAQNTFPSTGSGPCPSTITVSATPASATISECSWTQVYNSNSGTTFNNTAVFSAVISSPALGLAGPVTIQFADGMLRNPPVAAQYTTRLAEQSTAGWVTIPWWVNVGVPVNLKATVNSPRLGATTGAVVTYDSASDWADTNVTVTFPRWTAMETFTSTGRKPCPATVKVTATPSSATTAGCSWSQGLNGATLTLVIRSPGSGLGGPVRIALESGLLRNPTSGTSASIRLAEQSGAGWVALTTPIWLATP